MPDPYRTDPRWVGLFYYMVASICIGIIASVCILAYFLLADIHYDYQYNAFGFIGLCIGVLAFVAAQAVSRSKLVIAFGNCTTADTILKHKSLVVNGVKCGSDDDIDFVNYFIERYRLRGISIISTLVPFVITGFLYFSPGLF